MNRKKRIYIAALAAGVVAAAVFYLCFGPFSGMAGTAQNPKYEFQKGMCYVTWSKDKYSSAASDESLKKVAEIGTKWVAIVTTWYQDKCYTTKIYPTENTPSDESLVHAIKIAHSLGMKVMLKPHLDIIDTTEGSWRGEIACISEPDWQAWFASYGDFILHHAKIAQDNKVEMLCIGTELTSIATIKTEMWKEIVIKPTRAAYSGPLTYAANWNVEYMHVLFWDALDYVGIDAYFPLSEDKPAPSLDEIKKGWDVWIAEMEAFQKKVNKPIIFPEVAYCSSDWTTKTPWEEITGGNLNLKLQADCYRALFEKLWDKDWFYGMYWWKWGTNKRFGGINNRGFSPQNKPAQTVVEEWYRTQTPKRTGR